MKLGIKTGQSQRRGILTEKQIQETIDDGKPFGVLYGSFYKDSNGTFQWSGHWGVGTGYASAPGHDSLVVSNDPAGGVQRIQTYDDFKKSYVGDPNLWRPWVKTVK